MRRYLPAFALVAVFGCGPSKGSSGGAAIPFDQLAEEYAKLFCQKAFVCCDTVELQNFPGGEAECRSAVVAEVMSDLTGDQTGIAAGTTVYDGTKARLCFNTVAALSCAEWGGDDSLRQYPVCLQIFRGTVAPGGACSRSGECLDGTCPPSVAGGVCVARSAVGESCATNSCRQDLYCALDAAGQLTTCAVPKPNGMTCTLDLQCASNNCVGAPTTSADPPGACGAPDMCNGV